MGHAELAAACAPWWAAEGRVIRAYFEGPRSVEDDRAWILRQAHKEYWDGFAVFLGRLRAGSSDIASSLQTARAMVEELEHYEGFASLYDSLGDGPPLTPERARAAGWQANDRLQQIRARHRAEHAALGARAGWYTEGGHMELYSEAMRLQGRGGRDDDIARVCARVYADEAEHMALGTRGAELAAAEWSRLQQMVLEQLRQRVRMRWEQFGRPVPEDALRA